MAICYELKDGMTLVPSSEAKACAEATGAGPFAKSAVEVLTNGEYETLDFISEEAREALHVMESAPSNFVDSYQDFIVGSFAIPDMERSGGQPQLFSFYLDDARLIFVDGSSVCARTLAAIANGGAPRDMTTSHCLYLFMKRLLLDDFDSFDQKEAAMERIEERIVESQGGTDVREIMEYRRQSMNLFAYYSQFAAMADLLADNENKVMSRAEAREFTHVQYLADRFASRAEALKEYSLQLHELHQTRIDLAQNSIMQTFTIVTVLFAPLTLVTSWYGMNLVVLPGVEWPFTFAALIGGAVVCTGLLLLWFHRRRWL